MTKTSLICVLSVLLFVSCRENPVAEDKGRRAHANLLADYPAIKPDSTVNAAIEIPAGTNDKWEVDKTTGGLVWEQKDGKPRVVQFLPYPANYGMIPRTLLPKENGGDGDPLDILVLGPALARGSVHQVHLIGVLKLRDGGEVDDKLIAVLPGSPFGQLRSLTELESQFPGVTEIIELWFHNYKGPGRMQAQGFEGPAAAFSMLKYAMESFANPNPNKTAQ